MSRAGAAALSALLGVGLTLGALATGRAPELSGPASVPPGEGGRAGEGSVEASASFGTVDPGAAVGAEAAVEAGASAGASEPPVVAEPARTTRVPVLLVPGWFDTDRDLAALRIRLLGAGWSTGAVETLGFEDPTGSNRDHADELERAVDTLLARTGAERVDIVAHSMGGLATRWYLLTRGSAKVRRVVFLASPHRGTLSAHLAWGGGREEMMPDSPFLDTLNARAPTPGGVEAITVRTVVDTHVVPGESATLPGVADYELCCPSHAGLLRNDEAFALTLEFLLRG